MPGPGFQIADVVGRIERGLMNNEQARSFVAKFREDLDSWVSGVDELELPTGNPEVEKQLKDNSSLALEALDASLEALEEWLKEREFEKMKRCLELASYAQRMLLRLQHDTNDLVEELLDGMSDEMANPDAET